MTCEKHTIHYNLTCGECVDDINEQGVGKPVSHPTPKTPTSILNEEERVVWAILERHKGKNEAISADELRWSNTMPECYKGYATRHLRDIIRSLRLKGKAIGSSNAGYYLIVDKEDLDNFTGRLASHAISELTIVARVRNTTLEDVFKQAKLDFEAKD